MKYSILFLLAFAALTLQAQYRFDNVQFTTVYWDQLCQSLKQHPGYLLLDVRSRGEFNDTSTSKSLNIGRLNGATNIDINEIKSRLSEIEAYKNKPVFVYCSHSQRSRRVSKMLSDSGFTQVFNINGGLSNLQLDERKEGCNLLASHLPYKLLSPLQLARANPSDYFILDVRSDSAYRGISTTERKNAYGKLKNSVNLPLPLLEQASASLPRDKKILLVDETGSDSPAAAEILSKKGFTNLFVLFNGLDLYLAETPEKERMAWESQVPYHAIGARAFDNLAKSDNVNLLDVRKAEEFTNNSRETYRNAGNLKGAVSIPFADWDKQFASLAIDKEKPVVVYALSSQNEVFEAAKKLSAQGYKNVNVLMGGLFSLRWRAANIKGDEHLKDWVVNVPPENR